MPDEGLTQTVDDGAVLDGPTQEPAGEAQPTASDTSQTPAGEGATGDGQEPQSAPQGSQQDDQPAYVTREALDQTVSGLTQEMRRQLGQMQQMLQQSMQQTPQTPNQQPQDYFPDYRSFEQEVLQDPTRFYDVMKQMREEQRQIQEQTTQRLEQLQRELQIREHTERYYNYLNQQTEAVVKQYPVLQDKKVQEILKGQVAAHINAVNGDLQQVNIPQIAKNLVATIDGLVQARLKTQDGQPTAPGKPPAAPQGSPTKPAPSKDKREINTWDDFEAGLDELVAVAAGQGGE